MIGLSKGDYALLRFIPLKFAEFQGFLLSTGQSMQHRCNIYEVNFRLETGINSVAIRSPYLQDYRQQQAPRRPVQYDALVDGIE